MKKQTLFLIGMAAAVVTLTGCSSNEEGSQVVRKMRTLTITQTSAQQKSILVDQGENGLNATWEMGDQMTVYNQSYPAAGYAIVKASASTKNTNFVGKVDCQAGDVLRLFYPKVSESGSVTDATNNGTLTLDISNQKGTLEDIQQHFDFNYGQATVTAVDEETATANAGTTENLMAICKFTFKSEGSYLKKISSVKISGVPTTATFTLSASNTPALTPATTASTINISADGMDNAVYVALFPGETTPTFTLTAGESTYEGTLTASTLKAGKFYNSVVVEATKTGDAPKDYIEVCGIKWAKGNLQYNSVEGGDEGFQENWRIAPTQWSNFGESYDWDKYREHFLKFKITQDEKYYLFYLSSVFRDYYGDLYYSPSETTTAYSSSTFSKTSRFEDANRGDLAFWASKGKYRLPSYTEANRLYTQASWRYGTYTVDGKTIYGLLLYEAEGERVAPDKIYENEIEQFTESDIASGLFLPQIGTYYLAGQNYTDLTYRIRPTIYDEGYISHALISFGNRVNSSGNYYSEVKQYSIPSGPTNSSNSSSKRFYEYFPIRPVLNE